MLNQIQCTAAEFNAAAYNDADSIVLFLCKECAAAIDSGTSGSSQSQPRNTAA